MIPVFRPFVGQEEIDAVADVLRSGWWGMGPRTAEFEAKFALRTGAAFAVGTNSGTMALQLAYHTIGVRGREVIAPSLTMAATLHSIVHAGGRPVFADVEPDTLTLDPEDVERRLTPNTAAIVAVDYAGHPADYERLRALARSAGIPIVADAAHAAGASYRGAAVGSLVEYTCFSFQAVKNLAMGDGGAITLDDPEAAARLRRLRWYGLTRDTWARVKASGYQWEYELDDIGFKAHLTDIPAAIGLVQLGRLAATNGRRREVAKRYSEAFAGIEWLRCPAERADVESSWHLYAVRLGGDAPERERFIAHLAERGVSCGVHYKPIHLYAVYAEFAEPLRAAPLRVTDDAWPRLVTLPLFPAITDEEVDQVIEAVRSFTPGPGR